MSIRSVCPECGLPVKATILMIVDPKAEELTPLGRPALIAWGLVAWGGFGVAATVFAWAARFNEGYFAATKNLLAPVPVLGLLTAIATAASAIAVSVAVRPHAGLSWLTSVRAGVGVVLQLCAAWLVWAIGGVHDAAEPLAYLGADDPSETRLVLRLLLAASLAGSLLCLRPNLRLLASRSVVVREGRVDRQSIMAVIGAIGVSGGGDALMLAAAQGDSWIGDTVRIGHVALVALGSVLFTSGVVNLFRDTLRLRPVLASSGIGLSHIVNFRKA